MRDLRYAARQLCRTPGFTLTVLATLGLCIGANTAIYSIVDAVLLRPLPYPQPERLAMAAYTVKSSAGEFTSYGQNGLMWETIRDHATAIDAAAFSRGGQGVNLAFQGQAQYVKQQRVAAGFFHVLGVEPLFGREFSRAEDTRGGAPVTVLSYALWQRLFQGDAGAVGKAILLRGEPYTVVGIMPEGFRTTAPADAWTPLRPSRTGEGQGINYGIVARLKPGVTWAEADGQLDGLMQPVLARMGRKDGAVHERLMPLQTGLTSSLRSSLLLTWAAVGTVLLIGCVNIAGLLLARAATRSREVATRMALGGSRTAIVRQLLTESALLALAGGVLGMIVGKLALRGLASLGAQGFGLWRPVEVDARVLAVTLLVALLTSLLFGLAPAFATSRVDLRAVLVEGGRGMAGGARRWSRQALVAGEVALGVVLLVGAGLLLRTVAYLEALKPGFDPHQVVTAELSLQDARYRTAERVNHLFDESLRRIRELSGVDSAAVGLTLPYQRPLNTGFRMLDGPQADGRDRGMDMIYVTPGYFETLRIPLLAGRVFTEADRATSAAVAIVNQALARRFLQEQDAVGRHMRLDGEARLIVGVVGDTQQHSGLGDFGPMATTPAAYVPAAQTGDAFLQLVHTWFAPYWIVRTRGASDAMARQMQQAVAAVDAQLPFARFDRMVDVQSSAFKEQRYRATIFSLLAGLALLLAALGLYGLLAHAVTERARELGIRMALGATLGSAMWTVIRPGIRLALVGIVAGGVLARLAATLLRNLVWGVPTTDPATFAGVAAVLLIVALLASLLPALRLLRLDPAETLRAE
jgi:predicted permease